ncbi:MAG TPA: sugar phosphate isomerase/epimerase family protein [Methylobacterium sp.]|jgi:3-dehydroshikimate dehydratase|uniref:sugar phosphate isomerase/epimerase family protein n=1 Tax=Methylorubrum sp. B1-46 TaxID=2897334 RepID=UPI001E39ED15|nr:sugar phosphate isomerase/epimerase family protein [Methylorubrum sp. B1-46]UGB24959.1 sugar phosphate isomerase/epimerase [Methylorubrum sp. B1-46]HEV2545123.1 sugar phosphate isomerase/epimerase family protein [Methylobacterium sp.]
MRVALCTISFRHHLVSIGELARFARGHGFDGIELWGVHARNLGPGDHAEWLAAYGLRVPMLSDYLPLDAPPKTLTERTAELARLAGSWGAPRLRTFAGTKSSADASAEERAQVAARLRMAATQLADHGLRLVVETHPGTLADTTTSLLDLLASVDHPNLRVNFDTLHVWEGGDDPLAAHARLSPYIDYYHLKNVRSRADLPVFEPANVYAAAGRREGMTALFEGALDYGALLKTLPPQAEASLEWFGDASFAVLPTDLFRVRSATAGRRAAGPRHAAR